MICTSDKPCPECGTLVNFRRINLGYKLCLDCGEIHSRIETRRKQSMVQIPFSKGAYQYIHNPKDLHITNPKRTA